MGAGDVSAASDLQGALRHCGIPLLCWEQKSWVMEKGQSMVSFESWEN